jgi:solute carrier family 66 (lysosomal lysine-arginine transporter), member 1
MVVWKGRASALPEYCDPQSNLLWNLSSSFDTCIPTNLALFSTILGCLSILAWLFAQLPQIYKNFRLKSTAGLSIYFLLEWCLGDTANLVGAILTRQATWQVMVASYYTFVDCVLVFQFIYFTHIKPKKTPIGSQNQIQPQDRNDRQDMKRSGPRPVKKPRDAVWDTFRFPGSPFEKGSPGSSKPVIRLSSSSSPAPSPKTVLMLSMILAVLSRAQASPLPESEVTTSSINRELIGTLVSWASTALYLGSRLPQIYKNYTRRSTSGLSLSLFVAAFFGNLFYSTSLLSNPLAWGSYPAYGLHGWVGPEGSDRLTWVSLAAPFFFGAAGVLALDAAVGVQFLIYGEGERGVKVISVPDDDGNTHWRRVSGWMRGWVPSPRLGPQRGLPFTLDNEDGDDRPLLNRDSLEDRRYGGTTN